MLKKKILFGFILALLLICAGCSKIEAGNTSTKIPDISAWVVDWDLKRGLQEAGSISTSLNSLELFAVYFDKDGKLFLPESLKELLKEKGEGLKDEELKNTYITVVNDIVLDNKSSIPKDPKIIESIMSDEKRRKEHIEGLVDLVVKNSFAGLVLDYEKIPFDAWDEYAAFIDELGSRLKKEGKNLRVVLEPGSPIDSVKLPREFEYTMMAYNLYNTNTVPGPKADKKFIENLSDKMNKNFDNKRIAFSLGGFDWPEKGKAVALTQLEAEELLLKFGSEKKRYADSEAVYFNYTDENGVKHTVCYADTQTIIYWIKTAQEKGIDSFALWRLGGNSPDTLSKVVDYAKSTAPLKNVSRGTNSAARGGEAVKSDVIPSVVTGRKVLSLTFNGLPDEQETEKILNELDALNIKAAFFISGIKAGEEQEAARMIAERGHELGDSTLTGADLTKESYDEKIRQISKSHDAITKFAGTEPKYLRPGHGAVDGEVQLAAANCGYDNIVTYSVNPQDWDNKTPEEVAKLVSDKKKKGGIIILNADKNPRVHEAIPLIYESLKAKGYELVPLWQLIEIYKDRKDNRYIPDHNVVKIDPDNKNTQYRIVEKGPQGQKRIAITFDDWGSDDTIDSLLDVLDKFKVRSTFFLRANGVERNPSLALAISEKGHEVANHTYSHTDFSLMTPLQIQEDIVKAHYVIASAINKEPTMYLRPPRGSIDTKAAEAVAACGYKDIIQYSVDPSDWKREVTAEEISNYAVDNAFDGGIILLHMLDNINTAEALPKIIEGLRAKGYTFVTIGEMLNNK